MNRRGDSRSLSTQKLSDYFIPKARTLPQEPSELANHIRDPGKGIGYTRTATDHVFEKAWHPTEVSVARTTHPG